MGNYGAAARAALVNLSSGGLCARGALPARLAEGGPARDTVQRVALGLCDGRPPMSVGARLAWVRAGDEAWSFGLRFVDIDDGDRQRLDAVVEAASVSSFSGSNALRLRLEDGTILRASVDQLDDGGALVGAELPWLKMDSDLGVEIDGQWRSSRTNFIDLEVTPAGVARLRVGLSFQPTSSPRAERREITLPYFSTLEARAELPAEGAPHLEDAAPSVESTPHGIKRVRELLRMGARRRGVAAALRAAIVIVALSAVYFGVRAFHRTSAPLTPAATISPAPLVPAPSSIPSATPVSSKAPAKPTRPRTTRRKRAQ